MRCTPFPFGQANFVREGDDVTVVAFGQMVPKAAAAIDALAPRASAVILIDPRTTLTLDEAAILESDSALPDDWWWLTKHRLAAVSLLILQGWPPIRLSAV